MHELMSLELAKQRREELLREAELRRRAKALRAARRRDGRRSTLAWEIKRQAGGLLKLLRKTLRKEPERRRKDDASSLSSEGASNRKVREGS